MTATFSPGTVHSVTDGQMDGQTKNKHTTSLCHHNV